MILIDFDQPLFPRPWNERNAMNASVLINDEMGYTDLTWLSEENNVLKRTSGFQSFTKFHFEYVPKEFLIHFQRQSHENGCFEMFLLFP